MVSVYPDRAGVRWWTKAWFNGKEEGEPSVEIEERMAVQFIHRQVDKDAWLEEHYPKQMEIYHNAIEQTKDRYYSSIIYKKVYGSKEQSAIRRDRASDW